MGQPGPVTPSLNHCMAACCHWHPTSTTSGNSSSSLTIPLQIAIPPQMAIPFQMAIPPLPWQLVFKWQFLLFLDNSPSNANSPSNTKSSSSLAIPLQMPVPPQTAIPPLPLPWSGPPSPAWHGSVGHPSAGVSLDVCLSLALLPLS